MKRYLSFMVLLILIVCALTSCNESTNESAVDLSRIYDVPYEPGVDREKTVELFGQEYQLQYVASSFLQFEGRYYHIYDVVGKEGASVCFFGDGSIRSVLVPGQTTADINSEMTDEEIRSALEQALSEMVDFSSYEHFGRDNETFVCWYNEVDGILAEHVLVSYDASKSVINTLAFNNSHLEAKSLQFDLDEEKFNELIDSMVQKPDENRTYEIVGMPIFCVGYGELFVKIEINIYGSYGELNNAREIVVPASIISKNGK